jgi:YidC/Oxa1 family membrane protein insertase
MLYVLPFSFAIFGFSFPIGVLLYWLTTNIWSMGQQAWVIKRMPPVVPGSSGPSTGGKGGPSGDRKGPGGGGAPGKPGKAKSVEPEPDGPEAMTTDGVLTATGAATSAVTGAAPARPAGRPAAKRAAGSRKNKKRGRR